MKITAVLTLRNEAAFLLEWLAHHRAIGITDFLVFSNDCQDGTDQMLDRLQAMGWLTHVPNPGLHTEGPQWAALKAADRHPLVRKADWLITFDIDEFINIKLGQGKITDLIAQSPQTQAFVLTWRMFGNGGHVDWHDALVTQTFTHSAPAILHWPWRAQLIKTLYRNDGTFQKLGVHRPRKPDPAKLAQADWRDGAGRPLGPDFRAKRLFTDLGQDTGSWAQLNHYALGTMEGYLLKAARGRANREGTGGFDLGYWAERNFSAVEDLTIQRLAPMSRPILTELHQDPILKGLHQSAVQWRHHQIAQLLQDPKWQTLFGQLLLSPPSRILSDPLARRIWSRHT